MSRFFQSWVEETKKMDLAKVRDGYTGVPWSSERREGASWRIAEAMLLVEETGLLLLKAKRMLGSQISQNLLPLDQLKLDLVRSLASLV